LISSEMFPGVHDGVDLLPFSRELDELLEAQLQL
jgi:hypothetical protein